jgi:hypothetical protein
MRTAWKILPILMLAAALATAVTTRQAQEYRKRVASGRAIAGSAASAGIGQLRNRPHEWGQGAAGYFKRFGSSLGQHVLKGSIQMGVAAVHHENLRYQRSDRHGFWPRTRYAIRSTFIVPKTNRPGKKTVALGRVSGNLGAGLISRAWQPTSSAGLGAGLATGGIGLGADVGANMAREFWPRKHSKSDKNVRQRTDSSKTVKVNTTEWAARSHSRLY